MTAPLVFLDTETTELSLDDDIWEFAAIRREADGTETDLHIFIDHDLSKCAKLPQSFRDDHNDRYRDHRAYTIGDATYAIRRFIDGPHNVEQKAHIVGAVPNFDTERIARLYRGIGVLPNWHYHLIDVENLAVGYLAAKVAAVRKGGHDVTLADMIAPPWKSDDLAAALGVTITEAERHTAMGDARWAMRIYDAVMAGAA